MPVGIGTGKLADVVALAGIMLAAQLPQVGSVVKIIGPVGDGLLPGPGEEGAQQGQILRRDGEEPQGLSRRAQSSRRRRRAWDTSPSMGME